MKYTEHLHAYALLPRILESIQRLPLDDLEAIADDMNAESNGAAAMLGALINAYMDDIPPEKAMTDAAAELEAHTARIAELYAAIDRERKERNHAIQ